MNREAMSIILLSCLISDNSVTVLLLECVTNVKSKNIVMWQFCQIPVEMYLFYSDWYSMFEPIYISIIFYFCKMANLNSLLAWHTCKTDAAIHILHCMVHLLTMLQFQCHQNMEKKNKNKKQPGLVLIWSTGLETILIFNNCTSHVLTIQQCHRKKSTDVLQCCCRQQSWNYGFIMNWTGLLLVLPQYNLQSSHIFK